MSRLTHVTCNADIGSSRAVPFLDESVFPQEGVRRVDLETLFKTAI